MEEQRLSIAQEHRDGASISSLAESYEVSRKTIYKWLQRYEQQGPSGLVDRCRRPLHSPNQVSLEVEQAIVKARHRWKWG
ncbi:MAG: helix-turn-helix domain-containing protein, partial [Acidobacteria bacterium]|nr:helix-turn-helix domain-containing protein [Acidobacteriota bacterium]